MKFLEYIKGLRLGKEAHRLEKEAMSDPFLQDAIDGYDTFPGDEHAKYIQEIEKQIARRIMHSPKRVIVFNIAAAILLLGLVGGYVMLSDKETSNNTIAMVRMAEESILPSYTPPEIEEELQDYKERGETKNVHHPTKENKVKKSTKNTEKDNKEIPSLKKEKIGRPVLASSPIIGNIEVEAFQEKRADIRNDLAEGKNPDVNQEELYEAQKNNITSTIMLDQEVENKTSATNYLTADIAIEQARNLKLSEPSASSTRRIMPESSQKESQPLIGLKAYKKYIQENLAKDTINLEQITQLTIRFEVDNAGRPINITILPPNMSKTLNNHIIELVRNGSNWQPSVPSVTLTVPLSFQSK